MTQRDVAVVGFAHAPHVAGQLAEQTFDERCPASSQSTQKKHL